MVGISKGNMTRSTGYTSGVGQTHFGGGSDITGDILNFPNNFDTSRG